MIQVLPVTIVIGDCADQVQKCCYWIQRLCIHTYQNPDILKAVL